MKFTLEELQAKTDAELIELCATEVMRWVKGEVFLHTLKKAVTAWLSAETRNGMATEGWNPLTDWNYTMQLVEKMHGLQNRSGDHWDFVMDWSGPSVVVRFGELFDECASVESEPNPQRAIVVAALLTVA